MESVQVASQHPCQFQGSMPVCVEPPSPQWRPNNGGPQHTITFGLPSDASEWWGTEGGWDEPPHDIPMPGKKRRRRHKRSHKANLLQQQLLEGQQEGSDLEESQPAANEWSESSTLQHAQCESAPASQPRFHCPQEHLDVMTGSANIPTAMCSNVSRICNTGHGLVQWLPPVWTRSAKLVSPGLALQCTIDWSAQNLSDVEFIVCLTRLRRDINRAKAAAVRQLVDPDTCLSPDLECVVVHVQSMDLSSNPLSSECCAALVALCRTEDVSVNVLRLDRTKVDDRGAAALCHLLLASSPFRVDHTGFCRQLPLQPATQQLCTADGTTMTTLPCASTPASVVACLLAPVAELHLNHTNVSAEGLRLLVATAVHSKCYPLMRPEAVGTAPRTLQQTLPLAEQEGIWPCPILIKMDVGPMLQYRALGHDVDVPVLEEYDHLPQNLWCSGIPLDSSLPLTSDQCACCMCSWTDYTTPATAASSCPPVHLCGLQAKTGIVVSRAATRVHQLVADRKLFAARLGPPPRVRAQVEVQAQEEMHRLDELAPEQVLGTLAHVARCRSSSGATSPTQSGSTSPSLTSAGVSVGFSEQSPFQQSTRDTHDFDRVLSSPSDSCSGVQGQQVEEAIFPMYVFMDLGALKQFLRVPNVGPAPHVLSLPRLARMASVNELACSGSTGNGSDESSCVVFGVTEALMARVQSSVGMDVATGRALEEGTAAGFVEILAAPPGQQQACSQSALGPRLIQADHDDETALREVAGHAKMWADAIGTSGHVVLLTQTWSAVTAMRDQWDMGKVDVIDLQTLDIELVEAQRPLSADSLRSVISVMQDEGHPSWDASVEAHQQSVRESMEQEMDAM